MHAGDGSTAKGRLFPEGKYSDDKRNCRSNYNKRKKTEHGIGKICVAHILSEWRKFEIVREWFAGKEYSDQRQRNHEQKRK